MNNSPGQNMGSQNMGSYEKDRELARHGDPEVRAALAARQDIRPEIIYFLAEDSSPQVRRAIAANASAPRQADLVLAHDGNEQVRTDLVEKIAKVVPNLSADEQDKLRNSTYEALDVLARDQATRVRRIIADTLKDVADAPAELINRLAKDTEAVVANPVLEFSPVLTDEVLLEIIESGAAAGGLGAISRRSEVNEGVAGAIAATDDVEAIADLLSNPSAQLREEILDDLIERAPAIELWHAPLATRPKLPVNAAQRLAHFLADNLLETLQSREDLDAETLNAVKAVVQRRIGKDGSAEMKDEYIGPIVDYAQVESLLEMARKLYDSGKLDDKMVGKSMHASDYEFALAALTVRSELPLKVVRKIFSAHSAKGVVAVSWKAGLPMRLAYYMQQRMAHIMPSEIIKAKKGKKYPLSDDEMKWQLEFFSDLSGKHDK